MDNYRELETRCDPGFGRLQSEREFPALVVVS